MISSKNCLLTLALIAVFCLQALAQSFDNVVVDGAAGDKSETSTAVAPSGPDTLMATWNDFSNGSYSQPGFAFSTDGGDTWSVPGIVPTSTLSGQQGGFDPSCAIDGSGREFYVFVSRNPSGYDGSGCCPRFR